MRFAQTEFIQGFWLLLALSLFFIWAFKAKKSKMLKFANPESLIHIASLVNLKRQVIKFVVISLVFLFGLLALMRPQWGFQWQEVKRRGLDILIAVDTSKSMLASDVKPNRLMRSKLAIKDLIKKLKGDRVGLIAFSGTAFLQCPLTVDYSGFFLALADIDTDSIPRGGTSISKAIEVAIDVFSKEPKEYKNLIIITDGEDHEGDPEKAALEAKEAGINIFCIGIGTSGGELIQVTNPEGNKSFLKDKSGNVVKSRLNEAVLQKIVAITGGTYVRASGAEFGLDFIYNNRLSKRGRRDLKGQMSKRYHERFQIPLVIALLLLCFESFVSDKNKQ